MGLVFCKYDGDEELGANEKQQQSEPEGQSTAHPGNTTKEDPPETEAKKEEDEPFIPVDVYEKEEEPEAEEAVKEDPKQSQPDPPTKEAEAPVESAPSET